MISVAEESGRLDGELVRIAAVTEGDLDRELKTAVAFAEPLMLFIVAGFHRHHFHRHVAADFHAATIHQITAGQNHDTETKTHHATRRRTGAFTLVELLLVLVILGMLAAIVLPKFSGTTRTRARDGGANADFHLQNRAGCL